MAYRWAGSVMRQSVQDVSDEQGRQHSDAVPVQQLQLPAWQPLEVDQPVCIPVQARTPAGRPHVRLSQEGACRALEGSRTAAWDCIACRPIPQVFCNAAADLAPFWQSSMPAGKRLSFWT